jgi:chorismate synthase
MKSPLKHKGGKGGATCRSGGVQGGLSNGENIVIKVAFKPTSTIAKKQNTVSRDGEDVDLLARGRHDPCVVPRAVPMVEAMVALVLADQLLQVGSLFLVGVATFLGVLSGYNANGESLRVCVLGVECGGG